MFWIIFLTVLFIYFYRSDPEPILGIYRLPGKWYPVKYLIMRIVLLKRRWQRMKTKKYVTAYKEFRDEDNIDTIQPLSDRPQAFEAIFFVGSTLKEGYYVAAGCERRQHGIVNGLFYIIVPGKGILCSLKLPDTVLFGAKEDQYGAEGLVMTPIQPMKKWRIHFSGQMKLYDDHTKRFQVEFEAYYYSQIKHFNFDTELDDHLIAEAIALQKWNKEFLDVLQKHHQSHYEQMGNMDARFTIDGEEFTLNNMSSFRDHSYGLERNWDLMHRYVFFYMFYEDGTKASVGIVCQPISCSKFDMGYICLPNGEVHSIQWTDFKLYQHGENGTPPRDCAFQFKAVRAYYTFKTLLNAYLILANKIYTVQVLTEHEVIHYVGWRWQAKMVERFSNLNMNGIKGKGMIEFNYSDKNRGRPDYISKDDPDWFKELQK